MALPACRLAPVVLALVLVQPTVACSRSAPVTTQSRGEVSPSEVEAEVLALVNRARRRAGVAELAPDGKLTRVARAHSEHMRDAGFFDHVAPGGGGLVERLRLAGVEFRRVAENVAQVEGYAAPAEALHRTLMESAAHRKNLLDGRFTRVGIGVARRDDAWWLTQVFLRPPGDG